MKLPQWYISRAKTMKEWDILGMIPGSLPAKLDELVRSAVKVLGGEGDSKRRIMLLAALFYVAYTFDICPDWIPYIGFMDDISILAAILDNWK